MDFSRSSVGHGKETKHLTKVRETLQSTLTSGDAQCLICIDSIKRDDKIWSCRMCFCMFHIACIQRWAKKSMHIQPEVDEMKEDPLKWFCPLCRLEYEACEMPEIYKCFCGKVENPPCSSWDIPHCCGQNCHKSFIPNCGHTCSILCHPGPCPPCPRTVLISCSCLKSEKMSRRCSQRIWCCNKQCGKLLSCKIHSCEDLCHDGTCPPCNRQSIQKCKCGLFSELKPCATPKWQCNKACTNPLKCGNHVCGLICHEGTCPPCPKSGPRLCPCEKNSFVLPCTKSVLPCGDTCSKLLECELHQCTERCHYGACGKCLQMRVMKCRCGAREKSVPCCKEFVCDVKCKKMRSCGRHSCNRRCCVGRCAPCEAICGRTLNCGNHKCDSLCHSGPCYPCCEIVDVTCNCGNSKYTVPCGRKKSSVPPDCLSECKLPSNCHHKERHKHKCHFGSCPPCRLVCGKIINCGHSCAAKCHSAILTKVDNKKKMEGPWDLSHSYKMEIVCKPCPPCMVQLPVTCLGNHATYDTPCSEVKPLSCGRECGRILSCGNHACSRVCHKVANDNPEMIDGT